MRHEDLFTDERTRIEQALDALAGMAVRIESGETPTEQADRTVAFLTESEEAAYDASQISEGEPVLSVCVAEHEAARVLLRKLRLALDARQRGDTAAGPVFAQHARDYVSLRREHMRRDDQLFARVAGAKR